MDDESRLTCTAGDFNGAYVLRTLGSSEFNYETAKKHLLNLNFDALGSRTMHFNTVAEEDLDVGAGNQMRNQGRGELMRLATWVNLDSRLSVSLVQVTRCLSSLTELFSRSGAPEQYSAMFNADGLQNTFPTIQMHVLHFVFDLSKRSHSQTRCLSMPTLWHRYRSSVPRITQIP